MAIRTSFMHVFISWYRSACSASFALKMNDAFAIVNGGCEELRAQRARRGVNEKEARVGGGADKKVGGEAVVSAMRARSSSTERGNTHCFDLSARGILN